MKKELIELKVNGRTHELAIEPSALLLDVLRQDLDLTGSKRGCDESSCGACTVLIDGVAMMSCTLLAASCEEQEITTIEGVSQHGSLAAIQKAYGDWGGAQCGFCTPGFIMTVKSLLAENPNPSEADVRAALSSNLCRCTGYSQMYEAIKSAVEVERAGAALSHWKEVFVRDGSLRDIWVFESNPDEWQTLLDWLGSNYSLTYFESVDNLKAAVPSPLPSFGEIWEKQNGLSQFLHIQCTDFVVCVRFFSEFHIEMDVVPNEIDRAEKAWSVFKLMSGISRLLKKEVILTPERGTLSLAEARANALCSTSPTNGMISFHKAYEDVIY